jgi:hypothetical protein
LNGEFYDSFSPDDRARIVPTRNSNKDNQWYYAEAMASRYDFWIQHVPRGGTDTDDYIFLLSLEEVVRYFGDSGQLANIPSENTRRIDDQYNEARIAYSAVEGPWGDSAGSASWWRLRSPGYFSNFAAFVGGIGVLYVDGDIVTGGYIGVRPALWLLIE